MKRHPSKLLRLPFISTLLIMFLLAISLSTYFLYFDWQAFSNRQETQRAQSSTYVRERLKTTSEQIAIILGTLHDQASQTLKQRIRTQTNQAWYIAQSIWQRSHNKKTNAQLRHQILDTLRSIQTPNDNHSLFVLDLEGQVLLPPIRQQQNTSIPLSPTSQGARYAVNTLIASAQQQNGTGYHYGRWLSPDQRKLDDTFTYVRRFTPFNWVIGSSENVAKTDASLQTQGLSLLAQLQSLHQTSFIVFDQHGILRMFPPNPSLVGQHFSILAPHNRAIIASLIALNSKGGFLTYSPQGKDTLAYALKLPSWDWTLVATMPIQELDTTNPSANHNLRNIPLQHIGAILLITALAFLLTGLCAWRLSHRLHALLAGYLHDLQTCRHELKERSRELLLSRLMVDNTAQIVCLMDQHARLAYQNEMARIVLGTEPTLRDQRIAALFRQPRDGLPQTYSVVLPEDAHPRIFEVTLNEILCEGGLYRLITAQDITTNKQTEDSLKLMALVFDSSTDAIFITNSQNRILRVNQTFVTQMGYQQAEIIDQTPSILASGHHSRVFYDEMWQSLCMQKTWSGKVWNHRKNGEIFPAWLTIRVLTDQQGKPTHYVARLTDLTENQCLPATAQCTNHDAPYHPPLLQNA